MASMFAARLVCAQLRHAVGIAGIFDDSLGTKRLFRVQLCFFAPNPSARVARDWNFWCPG